jgi:DNA-binding LacI/PurR family transcriptional regulator
MTTLNDIARAAHVSKMTVSRVINHPEMVSEDVRLLVEKTIKELNYQPNRAGLALARHQSFVVRMMILEDVDTVEPYYAKLLLHLAAVLQQKGYALEIVHQNRNIEKVDGVIVSGFRKLDLPRLESFDVPVVLYGETASQLPFVDVDNAQGTRLATQHLIDVGYERIIFVGIALDEQFERQREAGYFETMAAIDRQAEIYRVANDTRTAEMLLSHLRTPLTENTAFVAASDRLALGIMRSVESAGFKIGEEIGIIGFDGVFIDQLIQPQLTTVRQPMPAIAQELAQGILAQIEGGDASSKLLTPELIIRDTTREKIS